MARRAAHRRFVEEQLALIDDERTKPLTDLVRRLRSEHPDRWVPYVAPYHGGVEAEVLLLYQDPGPRTASSEMIGCENDDPSAELVCEALEAAGIRQDQVVPWNGYPWFRDEQGKPPSARMLDEGLGPLREVTELLPRLHTVVTGGAKALDAWKRLSGAYPHQASRYQHLHTFHTSRRGITNGGRLSR